MPGRDLLFAKHFEGYDAGGSKQVASLFEHFTAIQGTFALRRQHIHACGQCSDVERLIALQVARQHHATGSIEHLYGAGFGQRQPDEA